MPNIDLIIEGLKEYIVGRTDVYARGFFPDGPDGKARYAAVEEPLTDAVLRDHVLGKQLIGTYQLSLENTVKWFCADIDAPSDIDDTPPEDAGESWEPEPLWNRVWREALMQAQKFSAQGLQVYIERSRSGNGAHVWGFLDKPTDAALVRNALLPHKLPSVMFDRLYPLQSERTKKGYGNLIALPYHGGAYAKGNSAFLAMRNTGELIDPEGFLTAGIRTNTEAVMRMVLAKAPKVPQQQQQRASSSSSSVITLGADGGRPARPINGFLKMMSPFGCDFMRAAFDQRATFKEPAWYAAIGQITCFEGGRDAAHIISAGHPKYNPNEVDEKFDHALQSPPVGCNYIHDHFPQHACKSCPMTAPYRRAQKKLSELVVDGGTDLVSGGWQDAVTRAKQMDSGALMKGINWGMGELDVYTRFRRSELTVVGAQVSMGKTTSMIQVSSNVARQEYPALVFSGEMGDEALRERYLAHFSGVDSLALRGERDSGRLTAEELRNLEHAARHLNSLPLHLNFTATRPELVLLAIERFVLGTRRPLDAPYVWFFDYLQYASKEEGDENPVDRISRTVKQLKLVTKITSHAGMALSQVGRPNEGSDTPSVTWFKGSGDIEAEMDVGVIWTGDRIEGRIVPRAATIVKQRNGRTNVRAEFLLDQATATYNDASVKPKEQKPLFGEGELGYGEDDNGGK